MSGVCSRATPTSILIIGYHDGGRITVVCRDVFICWFGLDWRTKNPVVGIRLRRIGIRHKQPVCNLRAILTVAVPFCRDPGSYCCKSRLIDAFYDLCGLASAQKVQGVVIGPHSYGSVRILECILQETGLRCRFEKLPRSAIVLLKNQTPEKAFNDLFSLNVKGCRLYSCNPEQGL